MASKLFTRLATALAVLLSVGILAAPATLAISDYGTIITMDQAAYTGASAADINTFLIAEHSWMANYVIPASVDVPYPVGKGQWDEVSVPQTYTPDAGPGACATPTPETYAGLTVAQMIYDWSSTNRSCRYFHGVNYSSPGQLNPLVILATLQKESSAVTASAPSSDTTRAWPVFYGFDETMTTCLNTGSSCDPAHNRLVAQEFGGIGQQLAESMSSFKRWMSSPPTDISCNRTPPSGDQVWQYMSVDSSCLRVSNGITYALYRYTPHKSAADSFVSYFTTFQSVLVVGSPISQNDNTSNDLADERVDTYSGTLTVFGRKAPDSYAWTQGARIAAAGDTTWQANLTIPNTGVNDLTVDYTDASGNLINRKHIYVTKHATGDINADGKIDIVDLSIIAAQWGNTNPTNSMAILNQANGHNTVDITDLSILAAHWKP